jgi:hypothetical protein
VVGWVGGGGGVYARLEGAQGELGKGVFGACTFDKFMGRPGVGLAIWWPLTVGGQSVATIWVLTAVAWWLTWWLV